MSNYFGKFENLEGKTISEKENINDDQKEIVIGINESLTPQLLERIIARDKLNFVKNSTEKLDGEKFENTIIRLGYTPTMSRRDNQGNQDHYVLGKLASEYLVVDFARKNYDSIMESLYEIKEISQDVPYLFLALLKHKEGEIADYERTFLKSIIELQNRDNTFRLRKCLVHQINELVSEKNLELPEVRYNPAYYSHTGGSPSNDFNATFENIDDDATNRSKLLLELVLKDPTRFRSGYFNDSAFELMKAGSLQLGRWYSGARQPMICYDMIQAFPEDIKLPREYTEKILSSIFTQWNKERMVAGAIIDRAYRIESERGPLIL